VDEEVVMMMMSEGLAVVKGMERVWG